MNIDDDFAFNIVQDFRKKEISTIAKGLFISNYCKEKKISLREFSRETGLPYSTVQDYVSNRQARKYHEIKSNQIFSYADRLVFLLSKNTNLNDKEKSKLNELKKILEAL